MTAAMEMPEDGTSASESPRLREAFCAPCGRTTYLAPDSALACPVCSSPLVEVIGKTEDGIA
jgi:hypothetical protein